VVTVVIPRLRERQASVGGVIVGIVSTIAVITIAAGPAIADPGAGLPLAGRAAGAAFRRATEIRLPANAAAVGDSQLTAVACTGAGSCIAGGSYRARGGHYEPMVVAESGGTWARAVELRLPPHAAAQPGAGLTGVACWAADSCVAVGFYLYRGGSGKYLGFTVTESHGTWAQARAGSLPANSAASRNGDLEAVACTGAGSCEAIGSYTDRSGKGQAMAVAEVRGRWRRAGEIAAPAHAGPNPAAFLHGLACTRAGSCAASGFYTSSSATVQAMRVTESNGRWGRATRIALPRNASTNPEAFIDSVTCTATGSCVGVGGYDTAAALQAMSVTEAGGHWRRATQIAAETGALNTALYAVACVTAARCVAVGNFANPADHFLALSVTRSNGRWGPAAVVRTPPNASLGGAQFGVLDAIACTTSGHCAAVGNYTSRSGSRLPMAATRP
jgi:hypothetical protein